MIDVEAYLARIGYEGSLEPSIKTLSALHEAHLNTVPFEDIDVYLGRAINLSEDALFEKIVRRKRGGFCYELNGLFGALLRRLGFDVTLLDAQVSRPGATFGPAFDHIALLVALDRPWLADVGFPRSPVTPLPLDASGRYEVSGVSFRITFDDDTGTLSRLRRGGWEPQYRFNFVPRQIEDFRDMCRFHATSPESPFYRWLGCTIFTADGRTTLSDDTLTVRRGNTRTETPVRPADVPATLRTHFGITLDASDHAELLAQPRYRGRFVSSVRS
ncbi:MAG: arylamine N-acetyltransferase [Candidatus Velthaea sp.]